MADQSLPEYKTWGFDATLQQLLETGEYSDLLVTCGTKQWKVHKAIVCSRCSFFQGACNRNFKEGATGVVELPEDDEPEIVDIMIKFLYTGPIAYGEMMDAFDDVPPEISANPIALCHGQMYIMGEIYGIDALKEHAASEMAVHFNNREEFITGSGLTQLLGLIWESVHAERRTIGELLLFFTHKRMHSLKECSEFEDLLRKGGDFAADLTWHTAVAADGDGNVVPRPGLYYCQHCESDCASEHHQSSCRAVLSMQFIRPPKAQLYW